MPRYEDDHRIYTTFEEFEREELRRADSVGASVDDLLDELFAEELDFHEPRTRRNPSPWDADDEE